MIFRTGWAHLAVLSMASRGDLLTAGQHSHGVGGQCDTLTLTLFFLTHNPFNTESVNVERSESIIICFTILFHQ